MLINCKASNLSKLLNHNRFFRMSYPECHSRYIKNFPVEDDETNVRFVDQTHKIKSYVLLDDVDDFTELKSRIIEKLKKIAQERNLGTVVTMKLKVRLAKFSDTSCINAENLYLTDENGLQFYSKDCVCLVYNDSEKIQVLYKSQGTVARKRMKKSPEVKVEVK